MPNSDLLPSLLFKINENQLALEAAIMELTIWVEQRGSADVADNVRGALKAIDRNEEIIKMTLAVMMARHRTTAPAALRRRRRCRRARCRRRTLRRRAPAPSSPARTRPRARARPREGPRWHASRGRTASQVSSTATRWTRAICSAAWRR